MRIDKFLKMSCIFKSRSSAEKLIEDKSILVNGKAVKPSCSIKPGDLIEISLLFKKTTYRILNLPEKNVSKKDAKNLYEITGEETIEF